MEIAMIKKEALSLTREWDKTFPKSEKVEHGKVTFVNRYGITLAADLYAPKGPQTAIAGSLPRVCFGIYRSAASVMP